MRDDVSFSGRHISCWGSDITSQISLNVSLENTACPVKNWKIVNITSIAFCWKKYCEFMVGVWKFQIQIHKVFSPIVPKLRLSILSLTHSSLVSVFQKYPYLKEQGSTGQRANEKWNKEVTCIKRCTHSLMILATLFCILLSYWQQLFSVCPCPSACCLNVWIGIY